MQFIWFIKHVIVHIKLHNAGIISTEVNDNSVILLSWSWHMLGTINWMRSHHISDILPHSKINWMFLVCLYLVQTLLQIVFPMSKILQVNYCIFLKFIYILKDSHHSPSPQVHAQNGSRFFSSLAIFICLLLIKMLLHDQF
jgi:hypothetical protein